MKKFVVIINGSAGVGKDKFVELFSKHFSTINYSSIDKIKEIASMGGWDGTKTEENRKFLSDLKVLFSAYFDTPYNAMKSVFHRFINDKEHEFLFLHVREPEEIKRLVDDIGAKTMIVVRPGLKQVVSNMADAGVYNYNYDFTISNDGTLEDLENKAIMFGEKFYED